MFSRIRSFLRAFTRRSRLESAMEQEFRFHVDAYAEDLIRAGVPRSEAERRARLEFGGAASVKEDCRQALGLRLADELRQDLTYAFRMIGKTPVLAAAAVISLALGIGANTAIFSLINAVMIQKLPVKNPERLFFIGWTFQKWPAGVTTSGYGTQDTAGRPVRTSLSYPAFERLRAQKRVFSVFGIAPVALGVNNVNVSIEGQASLATAEMVTAEFFSTLGVAPAMGRALVEDDFKPGPVTAAVITHRYWINRFGRDASAIGKTIALNGSPYMIVGVAPPEFWGLEPGRTPDIWVPLSPHGGLRPWGSRQPAFTAQDWWWLMIAARLQPGISEQQAQAAAELAVQQSALAGLSPPPNPDDLPRVSLLPAGKGLDRLRRQFSRPLLILMTIVALVLLIACANVATLLVARAAARRHEIGIRLSIGASRPRLIRQLLTESVLLAGIGGGLGLLFAHWGSRALLAMIASGRQPISLDVRPDSTVLFFTAFVSLLTGILFGVAPAFRATRAMPTAYRSGHTDFGRLSASRLLVVAQVALSVILLMGAGLFVRSLQNLKTQDLGFDRHNLLLFAIDPARKGYTGPPLLQLYTRLQERLQAIPGVRSASASGLSLLSGWKNEWLISVEGYEANPARQPHAMWNWVGPAFFETLEIPVLLGRGIEPRDSTDSPKVAVINEAMARQFFGAENPIGRRFRFVGLSSAPHHLEIVGVVRNAKYAELREGAPPTAFLPYVQAVGVPRRMHFSLRSSGDPLALVPAVRRAVQDLDPDLPLIDLKTQSQQIDEGLMQERLFARLSSFFGLLGLLLACVGLYATMMYTVTRRTAEIGIRLALGAGRAQILWMVIRQSLALVMLGIAVGIPVALALARFVSTLLYGLRPADPPVMAVSVLVLLTLAVLSSALPARRAARVDPILAVRHE